MRIQIRFNTDKEKFNPRLPPWRVIVDGDERLAEFVEINVPAVTTQDTLPDGKIKWHITCEGKCVWTDNRCTIISDNPS